MQTIDWVLVALMSVGAIRGWCSGLVKQVVSLVAFIAGLAVAKLFYDMLGDVLAPHLDNHATLADVLAFVLIWIAVPTVLGILGEMVTTVLDKLFVLGTINSLLGALLGLLKFQFIIGAVLWVLCTTNIIDTSTMKQSALCGPLKAIPEALYTLLVEYGREK